MVKIDVPRMEITLITTTGRTKMASELILLHRGVKSVYTEEIIAIVLSDLDSDRFMQTAGGSCIEYSEDLVCYYATSISLSLAGAIFRMFSEGDEHYKLGIEWKVDGQRTLDVYGSSTESHLTKSVDTNWDGLETLHPISSSHTNNDFIRESFEKFKKTLTDCEQKIISGDKIFVGSWHSITWQIEPTADGYHHAVWMQHPELFAEGLVQETVKEGRRVALRMEDMQFQQKLTDLLREPIVSVQTTKRMLRETQMVDDFLLKSSEPHATLLSLLRQTKEHLAWYRAKKKIDEAAVLEAADRTIKSASCRKEAQVLLQQDWQWVFINEQCPTLDKKPQ